ncbi:MAG TPA: aldo/keto reductase [Polyangiales bacterium]|nr:aldo/keto reductase [Polyangiales bacterium]
MTEFAHTPATIRLGDLEVHRLGFGAMQLPGPGVWGEPRDPEQARAVLRRAVELGVSLIDSAWYYGPHVSNRLIAEALYPYPKQLVIATKLGGRRGPDKSWLPAIRPEELRSGCEEDLKSLRLSRVDIAHLRWMPQHDVPFLEALDALIALQKEGKIRHLALSNVSASELESALERTPIVAVQNLYNAAAGASRLEDLGFADAGDQERVLALCEARGIAYLPFFPLALPGQRRLPNPPLSAAAKQHNASESQIALAWMLARSPAFLPIPGTSSLTHLEENVAARSIKLAPDEVAAISAARG